MFDANLFCVARVTNAVLPTMRARRQGRIVNVGSLAAWMGKPGESYYAASKAALARYTEALRHEVWHLGVSVSLVEPGAFRTGVLQSATKTTKRIPDYDDPRARSPRYRYGVGWDVRWLPRLKSLLPPRAFDVLIRRSFRLPQRT